MRPSLTVAPVAALVAYGVALTCAVWGTVTAVGTLLDVSVQADREHARGVAAGRSVTDRAGAAEPAPAAASTRPTVAQSTRVGGFVPTNDEWNDRLRDPAFWSGRRSGGNGVNVWGPGFGNGRQSLGMPLGPFDGPPVTGRGWRGGDGETYRTVCVRLCDGSFVPVSFSTTRANFDADAEKCERSCVGGGTRLFVYRNPGQEPEEMEDVNGQPYTKLPKAFAYKTTYDASCKCRPHPWEESARDQHKVYALEAQRAKGDRSVGEELKTLRDKIKTAEATVIAARRTAEQQKADEARRRAAEARAAEAERIAERRRDAANARAGRSGTRTATATTAPLPQPPPPVSATQPIAPSTPRVIATAVPAGTPTGAIRVMRGNRTTIVGTRSETGVIFAPASGPFVIRIPPQSPAPRPAPGAGASRF
jgi:hypothetical protein